MTKKPQATIPCPDCSGRGVVTFADSDVRCSRCRGKGTVRAGGTKK